MKPPNSQLNVSWPDYASFSLALGLPILIGLYFGRNQSTTVGYLLGGKNMSTFPVSCSLIASLVSAISLVGIPTDIYTYGTQLMMVCLSWIAVSLVGAVVFLPLLYKLQLLNIYKYFELRFCKTVSSVATFFFIARQMAIIPVMIYGTSLAFNQFSGINTKLCSSLLCLICTFYTAIGGFKAVVWADTMQCVIMTISVSVVMCTGFIKQDGFFSVIEDAANGQRLEFFNMNPDPTLRMTFWTATLGTFVHLFGITIIYPSFVQRYISLPKENQAKWAILTFGLGVTMFYTFNSLIGLLAYSRYKDCDPYTAQIIDKRDQIVPYFLVDAFGDLSGLPGLFLGGVCCATMSTMSTSLNTAAGIIFEDLITPFRTGNTNEMKSNIYLKSTIFMLGMICLGIVFAIQGLGTILNMCYLFDGLTGGTTLGLFVLGGLLPKTNATGAVWGGLTGILVSIWLLFGYILVLSKKSLQNEVLPASIDQCPLNVTLRPQQNLTADVTDSIIPYILPLGKVTSFYYSLICFTTTVFMGVVVSYISGGKSEDVNQDLLFPIIRKFNNRGPGLNGL